jgi:uncharacterized membrane protein YfcA
LVDVLGNLIVFVAAAVTGLTGFGFALLATPLLVLLYPPKTAVVLSIVLNWISVILMVPGVRKEAQRGPVLVLVVSSLVGIPLGAYLLAVIKESLLLALIGGVTILFALGMLAGFSKPLKHETGACAVAGFLSGLLGASTGLSGPPVVLFATNQRWQKEPFRANMTIFKILNSIPTLAALAPTGLLSTDLAWLSVKLMPAVLLGLVAGMRFFHGVSPRGFQRFVLILLVVVSMLTLWVGLR